jgi:hypothetical protein
MLPAGRHHVVFEYRPWTVPAGASLSLAALMAIAALGVWGRRADELPVSGSSDSIPAQVETALVVETRKAEDQEPA